MRAVRAAGSMSRSTAQTFGEPQGLERQVVVHHLELAFERDEILVAGRKRVAQRARELGHGIARAGGLIGDQRSQSVQRIEEKVRIELGLEQAQLRGLQGFAELRLAQLGLVSMAQHREGQVDRDPGGVDSRMMMNRLRSCSPATAFDRRRR